MTGIKSPVLAKRQKDFYELFLKHMLYLYTENKTLLHVSLKRCLSSLVLRRALGFHRSVAASAADSLQNDRRRLCQQKWRGGTWVNQLIQSPRRTMVLE